MNLEAKVNRDLCERKVQEQQELVEPNKDQIVIREANPKD